MILYKYVPKTFLQNFIFSMAVFETLYHPIGETDFRLVIKQRNEIHTPETVL